MSPVSLRDDFYEKLQKCKVSLCIVKIHLVGNVPYMHYNCHNEAT